MPVVFKPNKMMIKDEASGQYLSGNIISDSTTEEQLQQIQAKGTAVAAQIDQVVSEADSSVAEIESRLNTTKDNATEAVAQAQASVNSLESQKDTIAQAVASMAELGTDTSLSTSGMAADAKATGDAVTSLNQAIKVAADGVASISIDDYQSITCTISATNTMTRATSKYKSRQIPIDPAWSKLGITADEIKDANITFVTEALPETPTSGASMADKLPTGETGRHIVPAGTTEVFTIPTDAEYIIISYLSNNEDNSPDDVRVMTVLNNKQDKLTFDAAPTENSTNPVTSGGVYEVNRGNKDIMDFIAGGTSDALNLANYENLNCAVTASNTLMRSGSNYQSRQIPVSSVWKAIVITAQNNANAIITFVKTALPSTPESGQDMSTSLATGETGRHIILNGKTAAFLLPSDTSHIVITRTSVGTDITPASVRALTKAGYDVLILNDEVEEKLDANYDKEIDFAKTFGNDDYPLGWQKGKYNSSGDTSASDDEIRTYFRQYYTAVSGDKSIELTAPTGCSVAIVEYDENGENGVRYGNYTGGENSLTIPVTEGYRYKFCMGSWSGGAEDHLTEAFLSTVHAIVKCSFIEWQKRQDEIIASVGSVESIPEYYTKDGYLQGRLNAITTIQKTLSNKTDSFLFVTDYHVRTNQGKSLMLMKEVAEKTGIQKLFFAGDAGGRTGSAGSGYKESFQKSVKVWSDLSGTVEEFYGVLGNHEWIYHTDDQSSQYYGDSFSLGSMFDGYLNRFKRRVPQMSEKGSYYIDDPVSKIRYFFIQDSYGASAMDYDWMGKQLEDIDDGWYVAVIAHHGYIPATASQAEYDGTLIDDTGASFTIAKLLTRILSAYQNHTMLTTTIAGTTYNWDFTGSSGGGAIGVFCGHLHHGTLFSIDDDENEWGVPVWRGSTDSMQAASVAIGGLPWYWENGVIGGTKISRTIGTTDEQCFYAVQIDIEAKKVYITAIGGDHDWEFDFN